MTQKTKVFLFPDDRDETFSELHVTCGSHHADLMREIIAKTRLVRIGDLQKIADVLKIAGVLAQHENNRSTPLQRKAALDVRAVRWAESNGSVFTEAKFPVELPCKVEHQQLPVAFNVGREIAQHIADQHNACLA